MKSNINLDEFDIIEILAEHFGVDHDNVKLIAKRDWETETEISIVTEIETESAPTFKK